MVGVRRSCTAVGRCSMSVHHGLARSGQQLSVHHGVARSGQQLSVHHGLHGVGTVCQYTTGCTEWTQLSVLARLYGEGTAVGTGQTVRSGARLSVYHVGAPRCTVSGVLRRRCTTVYGVGCTPSLVYGRCTVSGVLRRWCTSVSAPCIRLRLS